MPDVPLSITTSISLMLKCCYSTQKRTYSLVIQAYLSNRQPMIMATYDIIYIIELLRN